MEETIRFRLNGKEATITVDSDRKLLWLLRTDLSLTGTKFGCGEGFCGACSVLVDGQAVRSCQTTVKDIAGKSVTTIEGLASGDGLHPLQKLFAEHDAMQCGYCTPGMIINAVALLNHQPPPASQEAVIAGMEDNFCRCGAHRRILAAIAEEAGFPKEEQRHGK